MEEVRPSSKVHFEKWFEEMACLAQEDPEAFERRREELIEEAISQADPAYQERLRRLQWRIDMERKRCKTALAACLRLYEMMWDFIYAENGFLEAVDTLQQLANVLEKGKVVRLEEIKPRPPREKAQIIPFPKR